MKNIKEAKTVKVIRNWSNAFAQDCYELEDGTRLYISYDRDEIRVEK